MGMSTSAMRRQCIWTGELSTAGGRLSAPSQCATSLQSCRESLSLFVIFEGGERIRRGRESIVVCNDDDGKHGFNPASQKVLAGPQISGQQAAIHCTTFFVASPSLRQSILHCLSVVTLNVHNRCLRNPSKTEGATESDPSMRVGGRSDAPQ